MVALNEQEKRVVEAFRQLDPQRRRHVLLAMTQSDSDGWKRSQQQGESRLRDLARQKGLEWDALTDEQRQEFVEELVDGEGR